MPRLTLAPRAVAGASLALLLAYGLAVVIESWGPVAQAAFEPWPLGGVGASGAAVRGFSFVLGLSLGWLVPGLSLALLWPPPGLLLLGRGLGLGVGYILATTLAHAVLFGHAPGRPVLLVLLALPCLALWIRADRAPRADARPLAVAALALGALTLVLWPKLQHEGLNGDGTEAYELARSLHQHPLPYWDLERAESPGRFGTPAVNPFLTNSALVAAGMRVLGRGELSARLPLLPALVIATAVATTLATRAGAWGVGPTGWVYSGAVSATFLLWNAYYVGYELPFTDLAEPAVTDMLMIALWLAGFAEVAAGIAALGLGFLLLAAGILYSAPLLATFALVSLALLRFDRGARALRWWLSTGVAALVMALAYGAARGLVGDWWQRLYAEYWFDLTDEGRRVPARDVLLPLALATGALPVVAVVRWRSLTLASRTLLLTAGLYLALVLAHSYKNLHYLAPLLFLLVPPSLEASGATLRLLATLGIAVGLALAWPHPRSSHPETRELGRVSCLDGLSYEEACLAADVVYDAFSRPGLDATRFAVGKHTFVRYALDLGGPDCRLRLSPSPRPGWLAVAGGASAAEPVALWARDLDEYARWRFRVPEVPTSRLFPRPVLPPLPRDAAGWRGRVDLMAAPGRALVIEDFAPERPRARLLVPRPAAIGLAQGAVARAWVNGQAAEVVAPQPGVLEVPGASWRAGWNLMELEAAPQERPALSWLDARGRF
jgi:hypothetical protein